MQLDYVRIVARQENQQSETCDTCKCATSALLMYRLKVYTTAQKMRGSPSEPAYRSRLQTTSSCIGKEPLWWALRIRHGKRLYHVCWWFWFIESPWKLKYFKKLQHQVIKNSEIAAMRCNYQAGWVFDITKTYHETIVVAINCYYPQWKYPFKYPDISNKSVDIKSEICLDIRFKSQLRGVNPSLWICPFYCLKAAFFGPTVWHQI